jgi:hypothetical protein
MVLVPAARQGDAQARSRAELTKLGRPRLWRHPLHTRGWQWITNVLRCLQLEAHGYSVAVTELVGWERSMKNKLTQPGHPQRGQNPRRAGRAADGASLSWAWGVDGAVCRRRWPEAVSDAYRPDRSSHLPQRRDPLACLEDSSTSA